MPLRWLLAEGNFQAAADRFAQFETSYPGSPLAPEANLKRGQALEGLGDTREAARAFLASFTGDSEGAFAPEALFELGAALGRLGSDRSGLHHLVRGWRALSGLGHRIRRHTGNGVAGLFLTEQADTSSIRTPRAAA